MPLSRPTAPPRLTLPSNPVGVLSFFGDLAQAQAPCPGLQGTFCASALMASSSAGPLAAPTADALRDALRQAMSGRDLSTVSVREIRSEVSVQFGLGPDGLDARKQEIGELTKELVQERQRSTGGVVGTKPLVEQVLDLRGEQAGSIQRVYLITISRVLDALLPDGSEYKDLRLLSRADVGDAIRDAFDNVLPTGQAGRPRQAGGSSVVSFVVVFRELHADGSVHFHAVLKLSRPYRFAGAKKALQDRHGLPSHWSCTHLQVWSAMRYLYIGTPTKPDVDEEPWQWVREGPPLDLFALSQQPYEAELWRKRREAKDKKATQAGDDESAKKHSKVAFGKLDLTSLIVSKQLHSKDALLAYVQKHGTAAMQIFVHKNQRMLGAFIEEALEWSSAQERAASEIVSDWDLLRQCAEKGCPCEAGGCSYQAALRDIFEKSRATLDQKDLAAALRDVLVHGPTKTTRVPFLVGPSNSGKSTVVYPFDDLFTPAMVLHKPALGSSFGLRNLAGGRKRFIFWDDFRPVEFAHEKTVPVSLFLSLFIGKSTEIQVSQSFNDGNKDVKWNRGVVFTAKQEGLWQSTSRISEEDIGHMRNRVREFVFRSLWLRGL